MSELKKYIDESLKNDYSFVKTMSETAVNKITLYRHNATKKQLVCIKSSYRNDDVFRILKNLNLQGLIPEIYEVASEDDALYILEEYIDGQTLASVIYGKGKLENAEIKRYLTGICSALEILHKNGIVHRDIKPENIMIKPNGEICLIDLSIAKTIYAVKNKDTVNLGTIGYAAPEQFGLTQSQPSTDIYSLGVMMNELVLGVHPTIEIPKGKIGKIITKCTTLQMSKRYQNVADVKKAILSL